MEGWLVGWMDGRMRGRGPVQRRGAAAGAKFRRWCAWCVSSWMDDLDTAKLTKRCSDNDAEFRRGQSHGQEPVDCTRRWKRWCHVLKRAVVAHIESAHPTAPVMHNGPMRSVELHFRPKVPKGRRGSCRGGSWEWKQLEKAPRWLSGLRTREMGSVERRTRGGGEAGRASSAVGEADSRGPVLI
jgi:hypothetical protein